MSLTITQENNTVKLEGALNTTTLNSFKTHFSFILKACKKVTLDIDKVTAIDPSGMRLLKEMYRNAVLNKNMFFVVGRGCKEVFDDFQYPDVA